MIKIKFLLLLWVILFPISFATAQNVNGIINSYAKVTQIEGKSITVENLAGVENDFNPGRKVLVIQMKGAEIDRSNTGVYGTVLDLKDAGNYEFAIVKDKSGSGPTYTITVHNLLKSYDPSAFVQIVAVPQYEDVTVSSEIVSRPWNRIDGIGGVVVLEVAGTLTLAANIDVSGQGFEGGAPNPISFDGGTDFSTYVTSSKNISGQKGEGIAAYGIEGEYAMGPLANGGGGGNSHNAGGGGGGNFTSGGFGGDSFHSAGGGGMPGKNLVDPSSSKAFMGGGGGGGQQNDNYSSSGGAGGGIIIIRANKISADCNGSTRSILANGADALNTAGNDGAGGGGAGGNILLEVNTFDLNCTLDVFTHGGNGGSVSIAQKHAGGGGGGSGAIRLSGNTGNAFTNFVSESGEAGTDCTSCGTPTGSSGEACIEESCQGYKTWPKSPNSAPIAQDDIVVTSQGVAVQIPVLDNDLDPDFNDILKVSAPLIIAPTHGNIILNNNIYTYTPAAGFVGEDIFSYQICDDGVPSLCSTATVHITVQGIKLKDIETEVLTFTEGQAAIEITSSIIIKKDSYNDVKGATVVISDNYVAAEDVLYFDNTHHISGTWDATNGTLILTGKASLSDYQSALRSITYQNTNFDNPSGVTRTVSFVVNDGELDSESVSRKIQVVPVNDKPELSAIETDLLVFTEGDAPTIITKDIVVNDVDNINLTSAVISISNNYLATEDVLAFTDAHGITGTWDATNGTLALTGNASLAHYQSALRSVTYQNTNFDNPSDAKRTVSFVVNDGELDSESVSRKIEVVPVNDAPELSAIETDPLVFTEGDTPTIITKDLEVNDVDNADLKSAVVSISNNYLASEDVLSFTDAHGLTGTWDATNGTLALTGNASLAHYQTALRSVAYQNTNNDNPSGVIRTVSFVENDGELDSKSVSREIEVVPVNDAPELSAIETDPLVFTEGDAPTIITKDIEVNDMDNINLTSAVIAISNNFVASEDILVFTDAHGITGTWDAANGTLTLTGNASLAHYQSALRSITYQNTNFDNPSGATRTVSFIVNDGELDNTPVSREIQVVPVNDKPELSAIETASLVFTEGDAPTIITKDIEVNDVDNASLTSAVISISNNYLAIEDVLSFTDAHGLTGTWDATNGTLTLTGNASLAHYQSALRSITYQNTNNANPSDATRTVSFVVNDGELDSAPVSREIQVVPVNDKPEISAIETDPLVYTEGDAAAIITANLEVNDVDNADLESAVVSISNNYLATEDVLAFTDAHGITGTWDATNGTLALTGNASLAHYQSALRSITYQNTNFDNPSDATREVSFVVNDGELDSESVSRDIEVVPVNDKPELSAIETDPLVFTEGDAPTIITKGLEVNDVDNVNLISAVIFISSNYVAAEDVLSFTDAHGITGNWDAINGTLALTGNASLAHYQTALRSITYQNTNNDNPSDATREVSFVVNDGELDSAPVLREIQVVPVNDEPELSAIETAPLVFTEEDAAAIITKDIVVNDVDNINLESAVISISSNYLAAEDVLSFTDVHEITGTWDAINGTLTLTGNASLAHYQSALRSITYQNTNKDNPSGATRTVSFIVNDGELDSAPVSRKIQVVPVNDKSELSAIETDPLVFTEGDAPTIITNDLIVKDVDNADLESAVISISNNYLATEDVLSFTDAHGITGTWDVANGTLTLTGNASLAHYQTALRSVTYQNTNNDNPSGATRMVSFIVNDGELDSETVSRKIEVVPVNDAPELSAIETDPLVFTEGDAPTIITKDLEVNDVDNVNLISAVIFISSNYVASEDVLSFTDAHGITGTWDVANGTLTLTGNASLVHYQSALRSITYQNTDNDNPSGATREVSFVVNDGELDSNIASREIQVVPVNDKPELSAIETDPLVFTEGDAASIITKDLEVNDVDNAGLESAVISISSNYLAAEDVLSFTDAYGITGTWDATNGTLALTGNASLAHYQSALRSVTYQNTNFDNPSDATRTVSFVVNDGELDSNIASRKIQVVPVNDKPELSTIETDPLVFTEEDSPTIITKDLEVNDVDNINLESAVISISSNYLAAEDVLAFTNAYGITGTWDATNGTLTLTGNASLAHYQSALRSITYQNTNNDNPSGITRTVSFVVNDGELDSAPVSREIQVVPVNDKPELSAIEVAPLVFTEGDTPTIITKGLEVNDVDNADLKSAVVSISNNYLASEDVLAFTDVHGITGTWDATNGTLTLTGNASLAHYQSALRFITYQNTNNDNPSGVTRTVSFLVNDGELDSETVSRKIEVVPVNDAPELSAIETDPLVFTEGDTPTIITKGLEVNDVDNADLKSAVISISSNYLETEDVLTFTNAHDLTGTWDVTNGTLTLTGNASLAHYQSALRSITYQNTNFDNPSDATREVSFVVNDGELDSAPVSREIQVVPVNDKPDLSAIETDPLVFTEGDTPTIITKGLEVNDVDNADLKSAVVFISNNYLAAEDILAFTDVHGITGTWDATNGTLALTGNASLAHYQSALRSVTYQNTNNDNPSGATRTVSFVVNDGELDSETVSREIEVVPVNDAPITQDDFVVTDKNVAVMIPVLANDYDVEDDELMVSELPVIPPVNGTLTLNEDNTFTYTPDFNFFGSDSFVYEVCDNGDPSECSTASVFLTINYKNYPPVAKDDAVTTDEDEAIIIEVLANDADPDEDALTVSKKMLTKPKHGKLVLADNKYTYTPNANYNGYDFFEYEICDSGTPTICASAGVYITIVPVNDAPEPADDYYANKDVIPEITGNVLDNDYDIEGDALSVSLDLLIKPSNGTLSMQEDGSFTYLPNPGFFGIDTFEYFACDDGIPSLCTKAKVTLKISSGVPKGFSPNGDGINDAWYISGIEAYPMNTVLVLNRWGDTVYEVRGYDNASRIWRGEGNKGVRMGNGDLPDGTYFYVIDFGNGKPIEKGFIIIKR